MANIKIADKPTLDQVKTNTETTNTKIGNTADSGASASTGSVNGKLNKLITDASTNLGYVMAGESKTVTPSPSTVSWTANSTTTKKVGSFSLSHNTAGADVVVSVNTSNANNAYQCYFYVSTSSATSPTVATLESSKKGKVQIVAAHTNQRYGYIHTTALNSGTTYYIHAVLITAQESTSASITINSIKVGAAYQTSTPCNSIIKSVQRGFCTPAFDGNEITINSVAPEKCLVIIQDTYCYGGDSSWTQNTGALLLPTTLILGYTTMFDGGLVRATNPVVWQIIEFY